MKLQNSGRQRSIISGAITAALLVPTLARACACGCGMFDVGTAYMLPAGTGGMFWAQYDYQDQNRNWHGTGEAPAVNNDDKEIETHLTLLGFQYMFNRSWGVEAELPYDFRYFRGALDNGTIASHHWSALGDLKLQAIYTGLSRDMSSGLTLGVKLPTGGFHHEPELVERDTQIGTGSADALIGAFHRGQIAGSLDWGWFVQAQLDVPTFIQANYRPGVELNAAAGVDYQGLKLGNVQLVPLAQILFYERSSDHGVEADPGNTGYQRILLSPGLEAHIGHVNIYADVELPVFQNFTGNQLAASIAFKFAVTYMF